MASERPVRTIRRANLFALLKEAGGPKELMLLTGVTDTHLTACSKGRRDIGDDMANSLEAGTGKAHGWMDEDHTQLGGRQSPAGILAHGLSDTAHRVTPKTITLELLVSGVELEDELYIMAVPDDALAPEYPKGTILQWSKSKPHQPGSIVVVKYGPGLVCVRQYRPGRSPGSWTAAAINPVFFSLESDTDSLEILLVAAYRPMP